MQRQRRAFELGARRSLLQRKPCDASHIGKRTERGERHRAKPVVGESRTARPHDADAPPPFIEIGDALRPVADPRAAHAQIRHVGGHARLDPGDVIRHAHHRRPEVVAVPRLLDEHAPHAAHAANQFRDIARHERIDARAHPFKHGGIAHELELIAVSLLADEQQRAPRERLTGPFGDARHLDPRVFACTPARFVERPALLELAAPQMHQREVVLRIGVIGIERERVPIMRLFLVEAPLRAERRADAHVNLRVVAQGQRVTVLRFGFGETSAQAQRRAEIHARFEMRRRQFDGALQAIDRVIETAEFAQRVAYAKMRARIRWGRA